MKTALDLLSEDRNRSERSAGRYPVPMAGAGAPWGVAKAGGVPFPFDRVDMLSANPREQLNQPYKNSVWVMRAIKKIAGPISAVPLDCLDAITDNPIDDAALVAFLQAPVQGLDPDDFNEAAVGWLKLAGEAFLIGDDTWLGTFTKNRSPLIMPRPDQMRQVVDKGELIGWEFRDPRGGRHMLLPEQVWQKKLWNPYDPWRGLSEYEAARIAAEGDYYAGEFVRNLMANNGDQGVYIVAKNGIPNDAQRAQIIADLREKRYRAQRGEFRAVFVTGDIEVQDPKITAPDANLVANRMTNRHEIFIAFGVPASMADVQASYSIGSASDRFQLIEESCIPTGKKIAALLAGPASRVAGRPVKLQHDWDDHSTMQAVRRERLDAAQKLWSSGMAWKNVNDYLRLGMQPFPGWDTAYVPISFMPLDAAGAPIEDPAKSPTFAEGDDEEAIDKMLSALTRRQLGLDQPRAVELDELRIFACACHGKATVVAKARDSKRAELARRHLRSRLPMVKAYERRITRELMGARIETLRKIETHAPSINANAKSLVKQKAAAADLVFNKATFTEKLFGAMRKQARIALETSGQQLFGEIGREDAFKYPPEAVLNFVRSRENKLSNVPDEIHAKIMSTIEEGLEKGDTAQDLASRVKEAFNGIADGRARTIGATETSAAYGAGRDKAMKSAGVPRKEWLTSGNANVRAAHDEADEQVVELDEPFIVDEEELDYPGDSDGSPENVINCHCVSIPREGEKDDE